MIAVCVINVDRCSIVSLSLFILVRSNINTLLLSITGTMGPGFGGRGGLYPGRLECQIGLLYRRMLLFRANDATL